MKNSKEQETAIIPYYFKSVNYKGQAVTIKMRTITADDDSELYDFAKSMARIFATSEPMTVAAGITEEECFEELYAYLQFAKKDELSLILTNEETGKIIGGIIGRDFYNDESEDPYAGISHQQKFQQVSKMIDASKKKFHEIIAKEGHVFKPGLAYRGAYSGYLGRYLILEDENGFSLIAVALRKAEEYVKTFGYKYYYVEATNPGIQKLYQNAGWAIDEIIIPYSEYPPFEQIEFYKNAISGIGNSLCGAIRRVDEGFPPLCRNIRKKNR